MNAEPAHDVDAPHLLREHSDKPAAAQAKVLSSRRWTHSFGEMLIETCADGSVWIDGKPVPETLPDIPRP